ncbi:MAG TPA: UDP-3-O-(3-hydroxymyristoyl)glucosamine N-acyltransferase [Vicinamibacterales bacterium]|nr:UDP-3-O-(3-hydroxymyristoyl)glucosamine N-acyltransferase [Vicinamibacterales bacterium]
MPLSSIGRRREGAFRSLQGIIATLKLHEIARRLDCRLDGDGEVEIVRVAGIQQAQPGDLTFVANARYLPQLASTRASAVILGGCNGSMSVRCAVLQTDDPYSAFARAVSLFAPASTPPIGIDPLAFVAPGAAVAADASVGPFVTIGGGASIGARTVVYASAVIGPGARIGDDCVIRPHVSIRERVVIGNRVTLHDGVVVGSDGFGFARQKDGTHLKIPQSADVVIEDDVEIGANSTIDRPAVGETRIGAGTKIDNLVHVAHGVTIGRRVLLAAQVGIAGSTAVDDDVMMAGQTGVTGHVRVGKGARIGAKSAVLQSVEDGAFVTGHPAIPHRAWRRASALFRRLPSFRKRVDTVEQRVADLEEKLAAWERSRTDR